MRVSKDPMEPLRCWKELFFGERVIKAKKLLRLRRLMGRALIVGHGVAGD